VASAHSSYATGQSDDFSYAVIRASSNGSVSISDLDFADQLEDLQEDADATGHGLFWFRLDGTAYRVRDRETVTRALEITRTMQELGKKQGKHGAKMGELGARMGEIGALQGRMGALRAQLALHRMGDADDRAAISDLEDELDEIERDLRGLRDQQRSLGRKQRALGAEQRELGRRQRDAAKVVHRDLKALAERAISSGKAVRER
jgi:hypothetical protein